MTTGERIRSLRKARGLSAEDLAKVLGVSPSTIYRYENGDIEKVPGDTLVPIANALQTTPAYLMGWIDADNLIPMPAMHKIPLLGEIACGTPILAEENLDGEIDVPDHVRADFALRCKGDSMIGARILDGDVVYIRQQPEFPNGTIAAVRIGTEATLKRVYYNGGTLILQPENSAYTPTAYSGEQLSEIAILGRAVAFTSVI